MNCFAYNKAVDTGDSILIELDCNSPVYMGKDVYGGTKRSVNGFNLNGEPVGVFSDATKLGFGASQPQFVVYNGKRYKRVSTWGTFYDGAPYSYLLLRK